MPSLSVQHFSLRPSYSVHCWPTRKSSHGLLEELLEELLDSMHTRSKSPNALTMGVASPPDCPQQAINSSMLSPPSRNDRPSMFEHSSSLLDELWGALEPLELLGPDGDEAGGHGQNGSSLPWQ